MWKMMASESLSSGCICPFCSPKKLLLFSSPKAIDPKCSWRLCIIIVLLLLGGGCEASRLSVRGLRSTVGESGVESGGNTGHKGSSDLASHHYAAVMEASEVPDCTTTGSCDCMPVGKCRPCSRLDIGRELPECLVTGFKQRSFCSNSKHEKYISCHYSVDPLEARRFWLFEGSVFSVGVLAYAVVIFRIKKMERLTALRIQQQINA